MKTLIKVLLSLAAFGLAVSPLCVRAQQSSCQFTTCVPVKPFQNLDNLQIYGAINAIRSGPFSVTCNSLVVTTGSINVTNTVSVNVLNTVTVTGNVGGFTEKTTTTLTPDGTFTLGNLIVNTQTVSNVFRVNSGTGMLTDITVIDNSGENTSLLLDFWDTTPTGTVTVGSNAVFTGYGYYLGSAEISNTDFVTSGGVSRAVVSGLNLSIKNRDGTKNIYMTVTNQATSVNYVAPDDKIIIRLGVLQD